MAAANNDNDPDGWVARVFHTTDPTRTQADYLPAAPITLRKLRQALENDDQFYDWDKDLRASLLKDDLIDIIDSEVPRPRTDAENGQNWKRISLTVAHWMKDNISDDLRRQLERRTHPNKLLFADTTYDAIVKLVEGRDVLSDCAKIFKWRNMTSSDFPSISAYVDNLMSTAARLKYHGISFVTPSDVMDKALMSLGSKPELKMELVSKMQHIKDHGCTFTETDLWDCVNIIHEDLRFEEQITTEKSRRQMSHRHDPQSN
ncbi:hypothetical protein N7528_004039 [Penicillium herquei]|nr:hypothetical protein N7528_004039 [Penicillium herquei]